MTSPADQPVIPEPGSTPYRDPPTYPEPTQTPPLPEQAPGYDSPLPVSDPPVNPDTPGLPDPSRGPAPAMI